ncbi:MAG: chorismate synthase [Chloroflexota bacterium]|nr:MAG: chorismate synthase [Chloroflexota bacterium]
MVRWLTSGESHGPCLLAIVDGFPAGIPLTEDDLAVDLARRQMGYGRGGRMKIEKDRAEITSGVTQGLTTGGPIGLRVENLDWPNWRDKVVAPFTKPRPGHADLAGFFKYGHEDMRIVLERASARETTMRVAVGAIARQLLSQFGMAIHSQVLRIGRVATDGGDLSDPAIVNAVEASTVRVADPAVEAAMRAAIDEARSLHDTLGGTIEVIAFGAVPGLGSHVQWDRKLDGILAQAFMSIHAIKAVAIGDGFSVGERYGTDAHDGMRFDDGAIVRLTNRAGGLEGGISNGEPIVVRAVKKPISTTAKPQPSVDLATGEDSPSQYERSDVCAVPAAGVVGEAMMAIVLADAFMGKFGGDNLAEIRPRVSTYVRDLRYWRPGPALAAGI